MRMNSFVNVNQSLNCFLLQDRSSMQELLILG